MKETIENNLGYLLQTLASYEPEDIDSAFIDVVVDDNDSRCEFDVTELAKAAGDKLKKMQECIDKANAFFNDVMPQIGKLCIQDYQNLNELGVALSQLKSD